jgi:hypothetical protein
VENLIGELRDAGQDINRRLTTKWDRPAVEDRTINGHPAQAVVWNGEVLFACDDHDRAAGIAASLSQALADGAGTYSFTTGVRDGRPALLASGVIVLEVSDADAALAGTTPARTAVQSQQAIQRALVREQLARLY